MKIRVLVVLAPALAREGLVHLIDLQPDLEVVAATGQAIEATVLAERTHPDVVVMDTELAGDASLAAIHQVGHHVNGARMLGLLGGPFGPTAAEAVAAGASCCLHKDSSALALAEAIRKVAAVAPCDREPVPDVETLANGHSRLSPRECEIMRLLAQGLSTRQTAIHLFISVHTVHTHRRHVMEKLGLSTTADIVRYAIRNGLVIP